MISVKSTTSDAPTIDETDEIETEIKSKGCFRKPFIYRILKLNSPEITWIILGCLSSISFGAITPVSSFSIRNYLSYFFLLVIFLIFFQYLRIICRTRY